MARPRTKDGEYGISFHHGHWQVRVKVGEESYTKSFPSVDLARLARDNWLAGAKLRKAQKDAGILPAEPSKAMPKMAFAELCARFLLHKKTRLRPATYKYYQDHFNWVFKDAGWAQTPIGDLTTARIQEYMDRRLTKVSKTTVTILRRALHSVFGYATRMDYLERNPVTRTDPIPREEKEQRRPSGPQLQAVMKALNSAHPQYKAMMLVLIYTGLRRSEILSMQWDWIDLDAGVLVVKRAKTRKIRQIDLADVVVAALRALPGRQGAVWRHLQTGEALQTPPYEVLRRILIKAGVPRFGFHAFRHAFCTEALEAGVPLDVVQDLAGHSDPRITRRYAKTLDGRRKKGVQQLQDHLGALGNVVLLPRRETGQ